ncbi:MAG: ABC transporter permease [Spirosomataceae bacterium]
MEITQKTVIEAGRSQKNYWSDIWKFKELLWILAMRDVTVRYKQTILGIAWSVVRPLSTMVVMVFVFGKVARLPSEPGVPFPILTFSGVLIWTFFANSLQQVNNSIVHNANLVSKVYFPRLIVSISSVLVSFVDFAVGLILLVPMFIWYKFVPSWQIIFLPLFLLLAFFAAFGFGLFLAVLNVKYRDFSQITPFVIQFGFYACPVGYSVITIEQVWWYPIYNLNPIVGLIDGFRWTLMGGNAPFRMESFIPSIIIIALANIIAVIYFRKKENTFVDYI